MKSIYLNVDISTCMKITMTKLIKSTSMFRYFFITRKIKAAVSRKIYGSTLLKINNTFS